jgi:2-polyprenyl-3-methyl-5-hydroxy-6-metoxy-1,4-benzoquinol methylase
MDSNSSVSGGRKGHWEKIYRSSAFDDVSWYQAHPSTSLQLIAATKIDKDARIIDAGGGASLLVDNLLELGYENVTVLDVSSLALERAQARLGERASSATWTCSDVIGFRPTDGFDVWHDRAVFHFLTDEDERAGYLQTLREAVKRGGHVIMATFAMDAPPKCSGLDVVRYSSDSLSAELAPDFRLVETAEEVHTTPAGKHQPFLYCRFSS